MYQLFKTKSIIEVIMKGILITLIAFSAFLVSCSDEENTTGPDTEYSIPGIYNYDGADYSAQTEILTKVAEIKAMLSRTENVNASEMQTIWDSNLASHVSSDDAEFFSVMFSAAEADSKLGNASDGQGGYVSNGEKTYLVNDKGQEYAQLFEKGLIGALMLHNVVIYTENDKIGSGVEKETALNNWDQAYGLFGAPKQFPIITEGVTFLSKYCNSSDDITGLNAKIMNDGYLLGRSAIMNGDYESVDEAVETLRNSWEQVLAATAIHYLNSSKAKLTDDAARIHALSEFWAFAWSIQFNPGHNTAYQEAINIVGDNYWTVTVADLNTAIDILAAAYGWEEVKSEL